MVSTPTPRTSRCSARKTDASFFHPGVRASRRRSKYAPTGLRFECARDLDCRSRRVRLLRVVVEEDVVAVSPQPRLAANEIPDLAHRRPPRRANRARSDLAPHRGQLAGVNSLYVDADRHSSIINRNRDRVTHCSRPTPCAPKEPMFRQHAQDATRMQCVALKSYGRKTALS